MKQFSWNILIQVFVFILLGAGQVDNAFAQQTRGGYAPVASSSSVQVDTSVLQQMEAARYGAAAREQRYDAQQRLYNSRQPLPPIDRERQLPVIPAPSHRETNSYESVKNSQKTYTPTLTAPSGKQVDTFIAPTPAPVPQGQQQHRVRQLTPPGEVIEWNGRRQTGSIDHIPEPNPLPEWRHDIPEAPVTEAVAFPVKVRERTDSLDPSLTKVVPVGKSLAPTDKVHAEPIPVPARRPQIKKRYYGDNDSTEEIFVSDATKSSTADIIHQYLPDVAGKEIPVPKRRPHIQNASLSFVNEARKDMNMPAIPSGSVETDNLEKKAVYNTDELGKTLAKPDRNAVVEQVNARLPDQDKKKTLQITDAVKAEVKTAPMKKQEAPQEPVIEASIQKETAKHTPRPPSDESDTESKFVSMPFAVGKTEMDIRLQKTLNESVLLTLKNHPEWRVQIQAFASEDREEQTSARRVSLSRALSVRDYLMENGVDSKRIDVRALGSQTNRTPEDRVDMVFFTPENG